jgi:hypothetical protein
MAIRVVAACAALFLVSGCAIHPLPEDVTGVDTHQIVRQIRCETREAVRLRIIRWLNSLAKAGHSVAQRLAPQYENDPESISSFHYSVFRDYPNIQATAKLFYDTGIAYNFDLQMSESNDVSAGIDLFKPWTRSNLTVGFGAGAKRKRSNNRVFTVTDTFSHLLTKLNTEVRGRRYCDRGIVEANYVYPISGRIGVDKVVDDFIELTLFGSLAEPKAKSTAPGAPTMVDTLVFTTTLDVSANRVAIFAPLTTALHVTNVTLNASALRTDIHQVAVGLAIAPSGMAALDPLRTFLFSTNRGALSARPVGDRSAGGLYVGSRVTGGGTAAERLAVMAIDQVKSREVQFVPAP